MNDSLHRLSEAIASIHFTATHTSVAADGAVFFAGSYRDAASRTHAAAVARELIPWRKGPFQIGELYLDAEWRSEQKWNRLLPGLPSLTDKLVADVGCNNGYYLFRIALAGARRVVGFDPTIKYKLQYDLLAAHAQPLPIEFRLAGWSSLVDTPSAFDVIFLMGVNYHAPNPTEILHACKRALRPGGALVCESIVVPCESNIEIVAAHKYQGVGGVYAIPSVNALKRQLQSVGFTAVQLQHTARMRAAEQRASEFSPQSSFVESVGDTTTAAGGYPPLYRAAFVCQKP